MTAKLPAKHALVIDAFVEQSTDGGKTWFPCAIPVDPSYPDHEQDGGPWSVPHATEIGRSIWASWTQAGERSVRNARTGRKKVIGVRLVRVRVVDAAGTVAEQWPKTVT